ncbi:SDR family oxidoreductase [Rhizobium sp. G187]|uniref:SDR family oxidoreductase n=1 Tax=Rhizobium sp. G187 TaxID=3451352 RepID=UPI003EE5BA80
MSAQYLVTGASGQLGRRVLHHLLETLMVPAGDIVAASRRPETLKEWKDRGVTVRRVDFDEPSSLRHTFAEARRVMLISTNSLDRPGHRLNQHQAAILAAEQAGVGHLLYTSMPDPANSPLLFAPDHEGTEAAIAASTIPAWTILRSNWYFENVYKKAPTALASGHWHSSAGEGRVAYIARDDVALAAAKALVEANEGKQTFTLTGSKTYAYRDVAALLSQATAKDVTVVDVPLEALVNGMICGGLPEPIARVFASVDTTVGVGGLSMTTDDFRYLTGRAPQSYEEWFAASADNLRSLVA